MRLLRMFILALLFPFPFTALAQAPPWQGEFEAYLDQVIKDYAIPGIAIEVVGPNGPLFQITRGLRDVKNAKPVTPHTLYAIGSTTKAFTGVLLAQLRDDGKVDFDAPVVRYWPEFRANDAKVWASLTLHDLSSHWTGVGRHDLAWYRRPGLTRDSMLDLIPLLPPSVAPRTKFIYNNFMLVALGHVEELITGKTWEDLLASRLLTPLGMTETNSSTQITKASPDHAEPYAVSPAKVATQVPFLDIGFANPAGGIYSNLVDMAKWVQMHLNYGAIGAAGRVVSVDSLSETYKPYSFVNAHGPSYAMGWGVVDWNGETVLSHDGGIDGFMANVSLLHRHQLGVVILMNNANIAPGWLAKRLWQHIQGAALTDTVRIADADAHAVQDANKVKYPDPLPIKPSGTLSALVGHYCNPAYGEAVVTLPAADRLHIQLRVVDMDLLPATATKFFAAGVFEAAKFVEFESANGKSLSWMLEDTMPVPLEFKRCH